MKQVDVVKIESRQKCCNKYNEMQQLCSTTGDTFKIKF